MPTYRSSVSWAVVLVLSSLGLSTGSALAGDFYWSGTCDYNEWWNECWFAGDYCDDEEHVWHYNNWGYQNCQGDPPLVYPGATDNVYLGAGQAQLTSEGGAAVYYLSVDVGGELTIDGPAPSGLATLTVTGPLLSNDGVIHLVSDDKGRLLFEQTATIEGGGVIWLHSPTHAELNTEPGATLTNPSGHTIRGRGTINAALVNNGTVTSDDDRLYLSTNDKTNNAVMQAQGTAGTTLYVDGITLTQSAQGQLLADGSVVSLREGATVAGGVLVTANGGGISITPGTNTLHDVTIAQDAAVAVGGTRLILSGSSLTNNGVITCNSDPDLLVQDNLALQGNGELALVGNELNTAEGKTLTHASDHTIRGRGTINATLVNNGTLIGNSSMGLALTDNDKTNNAMMKGFDGRLTVEGITLTQTGDAQLLADDGCIDIEDGATIVGGTLACANGGYITSTNGTNTLQDVLIAAGADVRVGGTSLNLRGASLTSDGVITVNYTSALVIEDDLTLEGSGEVVLSSGAVNTAADKTLTLSSAQSIHGSGDINAALLNYGTLMPESQSFELTPQAPGVTNCGTIYVPGPSRVMRIYQAGLFTQTDGEIIADGTLVVYDAPLDLQGGTLRGTNRVSGSVNNAGARVEPGGSAGTLEISEDYTQGSAATLRIELGGPTPEDEYDVLDVGGTANLDGTLRVDPIGGYLPDVGTEFTILTADSVSGQFAAVTGPGTYDVTYNADDVTLTVVVPPIPGDINRDGRVDLSDLGFLLAAYNTCVGDPSYNADADFDESGCIDLSDLGVLLANYGVGT